MTQFVREKQQLMMQALKSDKVVKGITANSYMESIYSLYYDFKDELFQNKAKASTSYEILVYLNQIDIDFKELFKLFNSPYSLMLFPELVAIKVDIKKNLIRLKKSILIY